MTKWDKILIVLILVSSVCALFFISGMAMNYDNRYVKISVDGELYKLYSLDATLEKEIIIETDKGTNVIHIEKGSVHMAESTCPDKTCIKQGSIDSPGEIIVCLPNKVIIEIIGNNESGPDTVSH
ncbi:hypothetical protein SAMN02745751_02907 [Dethiosulfatibacter aminovorans DSM 17477]|uniref:Uncharacterized protein n=1 Tax=Dethiosulfatibacter aminovorans DSM 17477 TaxID=1121476 RepID=A0A1M6KIQ1_9FIRM|nr:NusG domain II-containing protein [Dethiosulfatibacter aminovorans]SHJ58842.1 hypothetical protein SAMN02745751_02907 [Dethiosulfatibacter aminovorans DSM 17477]